MATLEQLLALEAMAIKPTLTAASNLLAAALHADKVDVFLYDSTKQTLMAVGTSTTPMGVQQHAIGLHHLPLANGGRTVEVFQTGRVYHHGQVDTDMEELRGVREALGIRSVVGVPLIITSVRRGVIQVDSAQRAAFSVDDVHFLEAVAHWVGMVIHHTELVEQLTREATAAARRMVAEELVTILAHDLGNHLTPLLGRAQLLHARAVREQRTRDVQDTTALQGGIHRLQRLIADLLDVGRIEQGVFTVTRQPVNLPDLAGEVAAALRTPEFVVEVHAPDELVADVDPDRIRQAIENLLANARRHAPGSAVVLAIAREQRGDTAWAVVSVQDWGPGIAPDVVSHLMERFVRGRQSAGLGIGLYLVRSIAEAHGGTLEVASIVGQGTTFRLIIPSSVG